MNFGWWRHVSACKCSHTAQLIRCSAVTLNVSIPSKVNMFCLFRLKSCNARGVRLFQLADASSALGRRKTNLNRFGVFEQMTQISCNMTVAADIWTFWNFNDFLLDVMLFRCLVSKSVLNRSWKFLKFFFLSWQIGKALTNYAGQFRFASVRKKCKFPCGMQKSQTFLQRWK